MILSRDYVSQETGELMRLLFKGSRERSSQLFRAIGEGECRSLRPESVDDSQKSHRAEAQHRLFGG